ncbi:MAG: flagellar hook-basal body complex protein FliE [Eubacteriaceae bacterium]
MNSINSLYNSFTSNNNRISNETLSNLYKSTEEDSNFETNMVENTSSEFSSTFKDLISEQIDMVNEKQIQSDEAIQDFISGESDDIHTVMIVAEEARLSLELAVQVRNKCIEAYKEINNMQL